MMAIAILLLCLVFEGASNRAIARKAAEADEKKKKSM